jgi:thiamine pyrophosphokinase
MEKVFTSAHGITLVGAGRLDADLLARALALAPDLIAADGGADRALALGRCPMLAVGDFDSITAQARARVPLHHDPDQNTTDFDKVLAATDAPMTLALGFTGDRLDHGLAAMATLARHPSRRLVVLSGADLCLLCPPSLAIDLPPGTRLSLFPLAPVQVRSTGLRWATDHLTLSPLDRIGTSNAVVSPVSLAPDAPGVLLILPVETLETVLTALKAAPLWTDASRAR